MSSNNLDDIRLKAKNGLPFAYYFTDERDRHTSERLRIVLKWRASNLIESRYAVACIESLSTDGLGVPAWKKIPDISGDNYEKLASYALIKLLSELLEVPVFDVDNREC